MVYQSSPITSPVFVDSILPVSQSGGDILDHVSKHTRRDQKNKQEMVIVNHCDQYLKLFLLLQRQEQF